MLSSKQVFVLIWTVVWTITVDGGLVRKKKDVLGQYSSFIADKSPNAMRISEHEVKFLDRTDHDLDFNDERTGQDNENSSETSNEIFNDFDYDDGENIRIKRQADSDEAEGMNGDPSGGNFKQTFMTMVETAVESAKAIGEKFSEAFPASP